MNALLQEQLIKDSHKAIKQAAVGSSPDIPYEQALANIAHDSLRSRSPSLLDYEIGFQLIDKSKGGEKALAVFGFQAGDRTLLVPVVYFDGEVSGHEICYVPDQNICVPSTEGWVSYLTQKQPNSVGTQVPGNNRAGLGIRGAPLSLITRSPMKYASEQQKELLSKYPEWCQPFVHWFAKIATTKESDRLNWAPKLTEYLKRSSVAEHQRYMAMLQEYPAMKLAAEKMNQDVYSELEKSIDAAVDRSKLPRIFGNVLGKPDKDDKYKIIRYVESSKALVPYDLKDSDREKLVQQGYIVQDKRKDSEKPKVYPDPVNQESLQLQHPNENCIDNVFVRPGDFERCLVLTKMICPSKPNGSALAIRLKDKSVIGCPGRQSIMVENDCMDQKEMDSFLDGLPKAKDYSFGKDKTFIILNKQNGVEATCRFDVSRDFGKVGEDRVLSIYSLCDAFGSETSNIGANGSRGMAGRSRSYTRDKCQIRISSKATSIRAWQDELVIPEDARVLAVKGGYSFDKDDLELATLRDLSAVMWKGLARLDVRRGHSSGREFSINQKELTTKSAAKLDLLERYQLSDEDADAVLDSVEAGKTTTFGIKKADGGRPSWLNDNGNAQTPYIPWDTNTGSNDLANPNTDNDSTMNYNLPVDGLMASQNDPSVWDPKEQPNVPYMQQAQQAASKGQRDVFNVKSIMSIANKDQSGDMGPIITCMDALGRRYLAFRWQREDMNDQYGTADASEIEDGLLNNFESLGEMVIAMYERDLRNGDRSELLRSKLTIHSQDTGDSE